MKPYYEEPGITIWNCDCREILSELPKVDLVLKNGLTNSTNKLDLEYETRSIQKSKSGKEVASKKGRNRMALSGTELECGENRDLFQRIPDGNEQNNKTSGHKKQGKRAKGTIERQIQGRESMPPLQGDDREGQVHQMSEQGTIANTSQERDSHRQQVGEPSNSMQSLPHQLSQKNVVEQEKICIITDPPYPDFNTDHGKEWIFTALNDIEYLFIPKEIHQFVFWPATRPFKFDYTALHIWHKPNGQSNEHYEMIYELSGNKTYRVFREPIINYTTLPEWVPHPTQKPLKLIRKLVELTKAQTILDPFMGSGTTLRAAKDLGRKAIGIEIEEKYAEIAVKRLQQEVLAL